MKKLLCCIPALLATICLFSGCNSPLLPVPEYPLSTAAVTDALRESELSWSVEEGDALLENQSAFSLLQDETLIAGIVSTLADGRHHLFIVFPSYHNNKQSLPEQEWKKAITFATLLYGGFEDKHQIYNSFTNDYDTKNTTKWATGKIAGDTIGSEQASIWKDKINDVYCSVHLSRPYISMPQEYLNAISFSPDADTFDTVSSS